MAHDSYSSGIVLGKLLVLRHDGVGEGLALVIEHTGYLRPSLQKRRTE
jgi:hypothetical protein